MLLLLLLRSTNVVYLQARLCSHRHCSDTLHYIVEELRSTKDAISTRRAVDAVFHHTPGLDAKPFAALLSEHIRCIMDGDMCLHMAFVHLHHLHSTLSNLFHPASVWLSGSMSSGSYQKMLPPISPSSKS